MVDALDLGSSGVTRAGSIPVPGTFFSDLQFKVPVPELPKVPNSPEYPVVAVVSLRRTRVPHSTQVTCSRCRKTAYPNQIRAHSRSSKSSTLNLLPKAPPLVAWCLRVSGRHPLAALNQIRLTRIGGTLPVAGGRPQTLCAEQSEALLLW